MNILGISGILEAGGKILDSVTTSDEERMQAEAVLKKLDIEERKLVDRIYERQSAINLAEAAHPSIFVAGWRPAIGWIGVAGLSWHFLLSDLLAWISKFGGFDFVPPVLAGTEQIVGLVVAMLGIGGMRTLEKKFGVARQNMGQRSQNMGQRSQNMGQRSQNMEQRK